MFLSIISTRIELHYSIPHITIFTISELIEFIVIPYQNIKKQIS